MKNLILINGAMGVGKTTTCRELQSLLPRNVFLDGDWCWSMRPFIVTEETKQMVQQNIAALLNNFLRCSELENIIFCWVMQEQQIIDTILSLLNTAGVRVHTITLTADPDALEARIRGDIASGIRSEDVIARALAYLPGYAAQNTVKLDVSRISAAEAAGIIAAHIGAETN